MDGARARERDGERGETKLGSISLTGPAHERGFPDNRVRVTRTGQGPRRERQGREVGERLVGDESYLTWTGKVDVRSLARA